MPPDLSVEEYQRILRRNEFSLHVLSERVGTLTRESVELLSIIQELQDDLQEARGVLTGLRDSEEVLHAGVTSGHAIVQPVAGQQPVPGGNSTVPGR